MIPAKMTAVEGVDVKRSMALSRMRHAIQDRMKQGKNKDLWTPVNSYEIETCCTFASNMLLKNILNNNIQTVPWSESFPGVALFADISGFTKLTEELDKEGASVLFGVWTSGGVENASSKSLARTHFVPKRLRASALSTQWPSLRRYILSKSDREDCHPNYRLQVQSKFSPPCLHPIEKRSGA
ncbi:hypothetical protein AAMO2058_001727700 [Amorphochlora amoebiformis]